VLTFFPTPLREAPAVPGPSGGLRAILSCTQPSYLSFVPQHYGHTAALDNAFRSLVTAARSRLVAADNDDKTLVSYGRALRSLQAAVGDPVESQTPEILCAVSMLALSQVRCPSIST
jgi:hypothetical protein